MSISLWLSYVHSRAIIGLLGLIVASGCGTIGIDQATLRAFVDVGCDQLVTGDGDDLNLVVIDWTGGYNPIYPDRYLEGVDLQAFEVDDGSTLDEVAVKFMEDVRNRISTIYCQHGEFNIRIINGEDLIAVGDVSVVHVTQEIPPKGGTDVGEGEYDPCNHDRDNAAILFGERLLSLSDAYSYAEWVNVFANICAHEIGHTLGYAHVSRDEINPTGRSLYVELMLGGHTMSELRRQHHFTMDLANCPDHDDGGNGPTVASGVND